MKAGTHIRVSTDKELQESSIKKILWILYFIKLTRCAS